AVISAASKAMATDGGNGRRQAAGVRIHVAGRLGTSGRPACYAFSTLDSHPTGFYDADPASFYLFAGKLVVEGRMSARRSAITAWVTTLLVVAGLGFGASQLLAGSAPVECNPPYHGTCSSDTQC